MLPKPLTHRALRLLCVFALLLTSACEHLPRLSPPDSAAHVAQLQNWEAKGKLAIRFNNENKSANFNWLNRKDEFHIAMFGFLGLGNAAIDKRGDKVTLTTSEGRFSATSAENLMQQELGWSIPVSDLRYWIKGLPSPHSPVDGQSFDPQGRITALSQNTWQLQFEFSDEQNNFLPRKILAVHERMRLTVLVKSWEL